MEIVAAMTSLLKAWRERAGRSTDEAAEAASVSPATWSRWETGARKIPPTRVLDIERLTGISRHNLLPEVFGSVPTDPPPPAANADLGVAA